MGERKQRIRDTAERLYVRMCESAFTVGGELVKRDRERILDEAFRMASDFHHYADEHWSTGSA